MDFNTNPVIADISNRNVGRRLEDPHVMHNHVSVWKTPFIGGHYLPMIPVCAGSNDVTVNGIDWILDQLYINRSSGERGANFLALSNNPTDTTLSDTTFSGEIQGSGLARVDVAAAGGITHASNTNTVVLSHVFTASAAVANIHKAALFQSSTETQPVNNFTFASDTTLGVSERLTISWTISIS